jgi:hypothetical protein
MNSVLMIVFIPATYSCGHSLATNQNGSANTFEQLLFARHYMLNARDKNDE